MEWLADPQAWIALVTLTLLEIVLGIDNIIFISILTGKLPKHLQPRARTLGLAFAMITRILLLFSLVWLTKLTAPLFTVLATEISIRDLVLIIGGGFLLAKSTMELHSSLEGPEERTGPVAAAQGPLPAGNHPGPGLDLGESQFQGREEGGRHEDGVPFALVFRGDDLDRPIDPVRVPMESIRVQLLARVLGQDQEHGHAEGHADDVETGEQLLPAEVPQRGPKIVLEHHASSGSDV